MAAKNKPKYCKVETVNGDVPYFVVYLDERDKDWFAPLETPNIRHYAITPFPPEKVKENS